MKTLDRGKSGEPDYPMPNCCGSHMNILILPAARLVIWWRRRRVLR